ncbi:hypothetical protein DFQ28_009726 [Apophysomyces sp. BC1034]|nr:hypothetical protein DFQ30_005960 [Apophysomyces sp. BC1015]KAG0182361.1 hypothetical protein DFQ29_004601 [Apophysomyces sp. BC1021]KAG0194519.1 hypothetical protein DFQ28_009726 [Apophysomyces sp. BC1034]
MFVLCRRRRARKQQDAERPPMVQSTPPPSNRFAEFANDYEQQPPDIADKSGEENDKAISPSMQQYRLQLQLLQQSSKHRPTDPSPATTSTATRPVLTPPPPPYHP